MSSSDDDAYGPPLPPGFKSKSQQGDRGCGPSVPPHSAKALKQSSVTNRKESKEDLDSESEDGSYGPALPPHLKKSVTSREKDRSEDSDDDSYGLAVPPRYEKDATIRKSDNNENSDDDSCGPALPPDLKRKITGNDESQSKHIRTTSGDDGTDEEDLYMPALPPHLMKKKSDSDSKVRNNSDSNSSFKKERILGPSLPVGYVPSEVSPVEISEKHDDADDDDEDSDGDDGPAVGPMPSNVPFSEEDYRIQQLELRAQRMRDKLEGKLDSKPLKRESWMLELPDDKPNFCGLAPRQFLKKAPQEKGDRSVWTDTPSDKVQKAQMQDEKGEDQETDVMDIASRKRDEDLTARVNKYNEEKRAKPLIDLHQKKLKKKEKESGPKERRPFSREEDLNVNKFDEAQKSNILKKARQLNDRFSSGNRKFL